MPDPFPSDVPLSVLDQYPFRHWAEAKFLNIGLLQSGWK